ncbi:MAG: polysaccharide deacetylase family protein [Candidatus Acidiferrales bacterium]
MSAREIIATGLHRTGGLRLLERVARSYEFRLAANSRRPHWSRVSTGKYVILCYHRVGTGGIPYYSELDAKEFEKQMRFLRIRYRILPLEQLVREIADSQSIGQGVAVTFDDGYRGLYTEALPILSKYQIPATVYLIGNAVETGEPAWYDKIFLALQVFPKNAFEIQLDTPRRFVFPTPESRIAAAVEIVAHLRRVPDAERRACCFALENQVALPADALANRMLNWSQVKEMQKAGISFGAHTMTHPVLSRLALPEAERELRESKHLLEDRLQTPVLDFAYPFGHEHDCSADVERLAARCGFRSAVTTTWGVNRTGANPFALRRPQIGQDGSLSLFAFQLNQLFLRNEEPLSSDSLSLQPGAAPVANDSRASEAARREAMASEVKQDA